MIEGDLVFFSVSIAVICLMALVFGFRVHFLAYEEGTDIAIASPLTWYWAVGFLVTLLVLSAFPLVRDYAVIGAVLLGLTLVLAAFVGIEVYLFRRDR